MRGDIDGDGKITENDRNRINEHLGGTITLTGADSWCAKVTGNNEISASDLVQLMRYLEGKTNNLTGIPTFADYYNNWTYHKVDDLTGYWTAEIAINGLKTTSDAIVNISNDEGIFYKSELSDGAIRFYATRPPIAEVFATITFKSGTGVITTSYECAKFHASTHSKNGADPIAPTAIGAVGYDAAQNLTDTQKTQARGNIGAAPDGFGLGGDAKVLTSADDVNTIGASGWYCWVNNNVPINAIGVTSLTIMRVDAYSSGVKVQTLYGATDGVEFIMQPIVARRMIYGSKIGAWEYVNPPIQLGVEYRTTERYLGKPVYKQLMNWGHAPTQGTMKAVAMPENSTNQQLVWAWLTYYGITFPRYKDDGTLSMYIYVAQGSNQFQIYSPGEDRSTNGDILAIVKYTKSTD